MTTIPEFNDFLVTYTPAPEENRGLFDPPRTFTITMFHRDYRPTMVDGKLRRDWETIDQVTFTVPIDSFLGEMLGHSLPLRQVEVPWDDSVSDGDCPTIGLDGERRATYDGIVAPA